MRTCVPVTGTPPVGKRQVLVEADEDGLTIYPQAISGDTCVDVPAP